MHDLKNDGRSGELKRFLRAMRARLDPSDAGLPDLARRRRAPGIRIEEAAALADVSLTWYSALESGKDIRASAKLLERVARALRLDADERAHLFSLALPDHEAHATTDSTHLAAIVDGFTVGPAFICDRFWNVSTRNVLADIVYGYDRAAEQNLLARMILEPDFRSLHDDWEAVAQRMVGILHLALGAAPDDAAGIALIARLRAESLQFAAWWDDYRVRDFTPSAARIKHPTLGPLDLLMTSLVTSTLTTRREQSMVFLQPPLNDETRRKLAAAAAESRHAAPSVGV